MTPNEQRPALPRVLGPWMATALVIGTVIGSGVFKKPQAVSLSVPEVGLALTGWVLVGVLTLMGSLALAEVSVLWPRAGGNYVFLREGYGRWAGFLWGWVEFWIIRSGSIAALASVFTESIHDLLREARGVPNSEELLSFWARQGMTAAVIATLAFVNARGTRWGGTLQVVVTTAKVTSLVAIALLPFLVAAFTATPIVRPEVTGMAEVWPAQWAASDFSRFGAALVGIFWAYHGWMNLAPVAEEIRDPDRNIPRSFIAGTLAVTALYVSANVAYYLVIAPSEMTRLGDRTVAAAFAERLLGPVGLLLAAAAVGTSVFGSLNGNLLVGPRLLYAMGHDGLAPAALARLHPRYQTPFYATLTLAAWSILLVVVGSLLVKFRLPVVPIGSWQLDLNLPPGKPLFDLLTDYAMFGAVSFETLALSSIFIFRRRYPPSEVRLPYRCRLYPWLPIIYVSVMALVLLNMFRTQQTESLAAVGFIAVGGVIYALFFGRPRQPEPVPEPVQAQG